MKKISPTYTIRIKGTGYIFYHKKVEKEEEVENIGTCPFTTIFSIKTECMVTYFCHHLSYNYIDWSDLYVDLSVIYRYVRKKSAQLEFIFLF